MPVGMSSHQAMVGIAAEVAGGEAALIVRGAGQRRIADHVAHGVDVRLRRLVVLVHVDLAAVVRLDADVFQAQPVGVARAAVGPQQNVGVQLLAALQVQDHAAVGPLDALVLLRCAGCARRSPTGDSSGRR